jgi:Tol biopolymer transport system component
MVVTDLARGTSTTLPDSIDRAIWAPDSRSLLASKVLDTGRRITLRLSPAAGQVEDTLMRDGAVFSSDSAERVFAVRERNGSADAWIVWRDSTAHPPVRVTTRLGATAFPIGSSLASISPSGRWIALTVLSNGRWEIFVAPTARPDTRVRITADEGQEPLWNAREDEIVFRNRTSWYAVAFSGSGGPHVGPPRLLFEGPYHDVPGYSHALMPDGAGTF